MSKTKVSKEMIKKDAERTLFALLKTKLFRRAN